VELTTTFSMKTLLLEDDFRRLDSREEPRADRLDLVL